MRVHPNRVIFSKLYPPLISYPVQYRLSDFALDAPALNCFAHPMNYQHPTSPWTPEFEQRLTEMWAKGLSATQIAYELGGRLSRNAVLGKVDRLNLPARRAPGVKRPKAKKPPKPLRDKSSPNPPIPFPVQAEIHVPVEQRKALIDLGPQDCHWPYGDPIEGDFYFCGGPALPEGPYCSAHHRIGTIPSRRS